MKTKIQGYVKKWESRCYSDGLPDESPIEILDKVPSYKRIAIAILKNDYPLKTLGFNPPPCEAYNTLKRIEISQRPPKPKKIITTKTFTDMKTKNDVLKEIEDCKKEITELMKYDDKKSVAQRKRLRSKLPRLSEYLLFLETNPSKEYIQKESERLQNRINKIFEQYEPLPEDKFKKSQITAHKKSFEKMWDLPKVRKQLAAVNYILK